MYTGLNNLGLHPSGGLTFGTGQPVSFYAPLTHSLVPSFAVNPTPTFTRATTAWVEDHEGILRQLPVGAARFHGARMVRNFLQASEVPTKVGADCTITAGFTDPNGGTSAYRAVFASASSSHRAVYGAAINMPPTSTCVASIWMKGAVGGEAINIWDGQTTPHAQFTLTNAWVRYDFTATYASDLSMNFLIYARSGTPTIYTAFAQTEIVSGASVQTPSEYVSVGVLSAPYHGAGADGVKYFSTDKDGNPIPDATLKGYLAEGARQNRCLYSQDFSNAAWVATNVTKTNTVAAPDGSTTGYTLTASAGNGTVIQDLGVVGSAAKTFSIWLKRKTGTGNIDMTLDGGSTWTTKTITSDWARYSITQTLADEDCGIRIVTSGDAVYVWGAQVETYTASGLAESSYIPTTSAAVTRNADILSYPASGNHPTTQGAAVITAVSNTSKNFYCITSGTNVSPEALMARVAWHMVQVGAFGGTDRYLGSGTNAPINGTHKYGVSFDSAESLGSLDGAATSFSPLGTPGTFSMPSGKIQIGVDNLVNQTNNLFGTIRDIRLWKTKLSSAALNALTS